MSSERTGQPRGSRSKPQQDSTSPPSSEQAAPSQSADFLVLQQLIGNQAVQRLLDDGRLVAPTRIQRDEGGGQTSAAAPASVPGSAPNASFDTPQAAQQRADDEGKLNRIKEILKNTWVGPLDETDLEHIWESFGDRCPEVAIAHYDLWQQCLDRGAELDDIKPIEKLKDRFRKDVQTTARHYMQLNRQSITTELGAIGMKPGESEAGPQTSIQEEQRLKEIQHMAEQAIQAKEIMAQMRQIPVGYDYDYEPQPGLRGEKVKKVVADFDPSQPPPMSDPSMTPWADVKKQYDPVKAALLAIANQYPLLYPHIVAEGTVLGDTVLANIAAGDPGQARTLIGGTMKHVLEKIGESEQKLGTKDLDDRDLKPIHQQLMGGYQPPGGSGLPWNQPLFKWAAEDMLSDHESAEFWKNLGLSTLAAAAFIVAELATFGTATFFVAAGVGVGLTAAQVKSSWEKYDTLSTAAGTEVNSQTALVTEGQVDGALLEAILTSAFAFLDVAGPLAKTAKGLSAVGKTAAKEGAEALGEQGAKTAAKEGAEGTGEQGAKAAAKEGAEGTGEQGAKSAGKEGAEIAGEQGAKAGVKEAGEQTGQAAAAKLRPQDAANWKQVEPLIGKSITETELPAGYSKFQRGGRTFIRREAADDARLAELTVDSNGLIRAKGEIPLLGNVSQIKKLADIPRPAELTQEMLDSQLAALRANEGQVLSRVDRDVLAEEIKNGEIAQARMNMVKGNATEVMSKPMQQDALALVQKEFPNARLHEDVRGLLPNKQGGKFKEVLFTDNMIAEEVGGDLRVHNYFEVKAGPKGGSEATGQIFEWLEGKVDDGLGVMVGGKKYLYDPERVLPLPEGFSGRISGLQSSPKTIITPKGAENLGLGSSGALTASSAVTRQGLDVSAQGIEYVVRVFLEGLGL